MIRILLFSLVIFGIVAAGLFFWKKISKEDVKITIKLIIAAIAAVSFSTIIYFLENS